MFLNVYIYISYLVHICPSCVRHSLFHVQLWQTSWTTFLDSTVQFLCSAPDLSQHFVSHRLHWFKQGTHVPYAER